MSAHYAFDSLISEVISNGGGTYYVSAQRGGRIALTNDTHSTGFYAAIEDAELQVASDAFDKFTIADYITKHAKSLIDDDAFLGFWVADSGRIYIDVSRHFEAVDSASAFGFANHQLAIWDIANGTAITL